MRLTAIILLIGCLEVSANSYSQQITLSEKDAPLRKVLHEIERQSGYEFFFTASDISQAKNISIEVKNTDFREVLAQCFKDQPLTYEIVDKTVVVRLKEMIQPAINGNAAFIDFSGRVSNRANEPLSGASVTIQRTKKGTLTDVKGNFILRGVQQEDVIVISYIGYKPRTVKPGSDGYVNVVLETTDNELDKVVVQAYGTTSQRFSTSNIATVSAAEIEKQPVMNPLLALQGRVAGLEIQQTSGYASAPVKVELRGRSVVSTDYPSQPLFIIDGVPLTVVEVGGNSSYDLSTGFVQNPYLTGPATGQSPLFSINPSDIESISVLKDAGATSIYGSRGANGVILITTKKGKPGRTAFNIHVDEGVNKVTRFWKMLNTPQYLMMRREALRNDGIVPDQSNALDLLEWDTTRYTNWQKELYGKAGRRTNTEVSLSGGSQQTTFRIAGTYTHSTEITTASGADQRAAVSLNLGHSSNNRRFTVSLTTNYTFTKVDMISLPAYGLAWAPNAPAVYDATGKLNWKGWESYPGGNPFGIMLQPYTSKTNFLNASLRVGYEIFKGLSISVNTGYNNGQTNQVSLMPIASQDPVTQPMGSSSFGNNNIKNWNIEPQINYQVQIGSSKLTALVGGSVQEGTTDGLFFSGSGFTSDALLHTVSNAPVTASKDNFGVYRYSSVFASIGYNLLGRYMVNLNARRDGSSNFGPGNEFGNFASASAGWIFTEENWFKHNLSFLSFGKLRGSYGTAGSDAGKPYAYITRWRSNGATYGGILPFGAIQHANPNYHWQTNKQLELAADLGFFKDWITASVVYYRKRTTDQLLPYPTPYSSGFTSVIDNLDALVQNAGWEFTIGGKGIGIHTKNFNWDWVPRFTFSINQNKFLSFSGIAASPFRNRGQIGQPLNGVYLLHYLGVDPQTGTYAFEDKNHDGVIDRNYGPNGDVYFKKISPSFSTGFGFNFDIKGIELNLFFIVKKQTGVNAIAQGARPGTIFFNQPVDVLSRWQKPGDITNVARFSTIGMEDPNGYLGNSDIGYTDASYLRLQNLSVSYSLPDKLFKKTGFRCRLYMNALNVFTITKYKGIDPDVQNFQSLPPAKTWVGGLSMDF